MTIPSPSGARVTNDGLVLHAAASATALIGLLSLLLEIWTDRWLADAIGIEVFISTPLGLGMLVMTVLVARTWGLKALAPAAFSLAYWILFLIYL